MRSLYYILACGIALSIGACSDGAGNSTAAVTADMSAAQKAAVRLRPVLEKLNAVEGGFPGMAAVVVTTNHIPLMFTHGVTRAEEGVPVTPDTPFYIASQTKSYVGLLAAKLDRDGVMPLDTTLAAVWPGLKLPLPADPKQITMRDLLSHQQPFEHGVINIRTAHIRNLPSDEYPRLLAGAQVRGKSFGYDNLGYLVYAAALETKTGRPWQDWLKSDILKPLGLTRTSPRSSDFEAKSLSSRHQWSGDSFFMLRPKQDAVMHAAGGVYTSPKDLALWLQANLRQTGTGKGLERETFQMAQAPIAKIQFSPGQGFTCTGYSLGQLVCSYKNLRMLTHTGGFVGMASIASFFPANDAGVAFMFNSDSETGNLGQELTLLFADFLNDSPDADERAAQLVKKYTEIAKDYPAKRQKKIARAEANPKFGDWNWSPTRAELLKYTGRFLNKDIGPMAVSLDQNGLVAHVGEYVMDLRAAQRDIFGGMHTPFTDPEVFAYKLDGKGKPVRVSWEGFDFHYVGPN